MDPFLLSESARIWSHFEGVPLFGSIFASGASHNKVSIILMEGKCPRAIKNAPLLRFSQKARRYRLMSLTGSGTVRGITGVRHR